MAGDARVPRLTACQDANDAESVDISQRVRRPKKSRQQTFSPFATEGKNLKSKKNSSDSDDEEQEKKQGEDEEQTGRPKAPVQYHGERDER